MEGFRDYLGVIGLLIVLGYCVWYLNVSNARRRREEQQALLEASADKYKRLGLTSVAVAIAEPHRFFESDYRVTIPDSPREVNSKVYGEILNSALCLEFSTYGYGPEELEDLTGKTQELAGVIPVDPRFLALHQVALRYLQARIEAAVAVGRKQAALYHSNNKEEFIVLERREQLMAAGLLGRLEQLQGCLLQLFYKDPYGFGKLQLSHSTLTCLSLDEIVIAV